MQKWGFLERNMKFILIMMIAFCSINSWTKSFETESGRKYKEFSEGEFLNQDKWFATMGEDGYIFQLGGSAAYGIITMCLYGSVYVRQINHGEFTVLYNKSKDPLSCDGFIKTTQKK